MVKVMLESILKMFKSLAHWQYFYMGPQHKSVPYMYKWLALHLHRDVMHTNLLQLHFISCRGASGLGSGNIFITVPLPNIIVRHWFIRINVRCGFPKDELIMYTFDTFEKRSS